jgi:hypothetical protein
MKQPLDGLFGSIDDVFDAVLLDLPVPKVSKDSTQVSAITQ